LDGEGFEATEDGRNSSGPPAQTVRRSGEGHRGQGTQQRADGNLALQMGEWRSKAELARQADPHVPEVHLGFGAGAVTFLNEGGRRSPARL